MPFSEDIQMAVAEAKSEGHLLKIIISLKDRRATQDVLIRELTVYCLELRKRGEEKREDEVLEILDLLVEWCHPDACLFP